MSLLREEERVLYDGRRREERERQCQETYRGKVRELLEEKNHSVTPTIREEDRRARDLW